MKQLIECVPNVSEGRDPSKIRTLAQVIESVSGVQLLHTDSGVAANRTVFTFVGEPEPVVEAAFLLIEKAAELIDMRQQTGEHPRLGATDVCPLIPLANIEMDEVVSYAHKLGERVGNALGIAGYYYEYACTQENRRNLAACRAGQYEGIAQKLTDTAWKPDFGPTTHTARLKQTGMIAIAARNFLIAYNINLNTRAADTANAIAGELRESGRKERKAKDAQATTTTDIHRVPGLLKSVKAIGWYIEEYGIAQVSLNLTNISITPMHIAFEAAKKLAQKHGVRVTGSELIGLVPLQPMLQAGAFYLQQQQRSTAVSEKETVQVAIDALGLDQLAPFNPNERIIEYKMK